MSLSAFSVFCAVCERNRMAKRMTEEELKTIGDALDALERTTSARAAKGACQPIHDVYTAVVQREFIPEVSGEQKAPLDNRFAADNDFCERKWIDSFKSEGLSKVITMKGIDKLEDLKQFKAWQLRVLGQFEVVKRYFYWKIEFDGDLAWVSALNPRNASLICDQRSTEACERSSAHHTHPPRNQSQPESRAC